MKQILQVLFYLDFSCHHRIWGTHEYFLWLNFPGEDMWNSDFSETADDGKNQQSPENLLSFNNEANFSGLVLS